MLDWVPKKLLICIGDHDKEKKDQADVIDKAINQMNLPGNSVGQSAATSQGVFPKWLL